MSALLFLVLGWGVFALWRRSRRLEVAVQQAAELNLKLARRLGQLDARLKSLESGASPVLGLVPASEIDAATPVGSDAALDIPDAVSAGPEADEDALGKLILGLAATPDHGFDASAPVPPAEQVRSAAWAQPSPSARAAVPRRQPAPAARAAVPRPLPAPAPRAAEPRPPSTFQRRWEQIERQLIENWTGILGASVLVAGITFLGGYTGLRLPPFYRVLMIAGAAAVLFAGGEVLRRRPGWAALAQWLRSSGAAVFLFACFASSAVPGLVWISDLAPALGVLLVGIAANLAVGYAARHPGFASLHAVLSLIPLGLAPQSELLLVIATIVTVAAIAMAFRNRWDLHFAVTLAAFGVFQVAWYARAFLPEPALDARVLGAVSALLVGAAAALSHYRRSYASRITPLSLGVHLGGWTCAIVGLVSYTGNTVWRGTAVIAFALVVFGLARYARRAGIRWVFLTDTLVAQAGAAVGVLAFTPFVANDLLAFVALLALAGAYLRLGIEEGEPLLERIGLHSAQVAGFVVAMSGGFGALTSARPPHESAAILLVGALSAVVLHLYFVRRGRVPGDGIELPAGSGAAAPQRISVLAVLAGIITIAAFGQMANGVWMESVAFGAVTLYLLLARRADGGGLAVTAGLPLLVAFVMCWNRVYGGHPVAPLEQLRAWLPLALAGAFVLAHPGAGAIERVLRQATTYLLGVSAALATYTLLEPASSLAPGVVWLTLSLLALELANRAPREQMPPLLHLGFGYLLCFAFAYVLVVLQTHAHIGALPVRPLVEAYALAVIAFWWLFRPRPALAEHRGWRVTQPYLLDAGMAFLAVIAVVELPDAWRPVAWALLAIAAGTRGIGDRLDARLRLYSVLLFWASAADLAVTTSGLLVPGVRWYQHPAFTGALVIAVQIAYLSLTARRLELPAIEFPRFLRVLGTVAQRVAQRQVLWLYYPFFATVALFLYWRFAAAWWTTLWAAEAFVVFVLSLVLREPHFRHLALAGLGLCVVRLLAYDMSQADLGLRGVIFVGVGLVLLAMNSLYNRYRARLT
jgi:hypothetical protein